VPGLGPLSPSPLPAAALRYPRCGGTNGRPRIFLAPLEMAGESLDDRLRREEPDVPASVADTRTAGRLVQQDEGVRDDTESEEIAADVGEDAEVSPPRKVPCTSRTTAGRHRS
jgi:hypothetical protein